MNVSKTGSLAENLRRLDEFFQSIFLQGKYGLGGAIDNKTYVVDT